MPHEPPSIRIVPAGAEHREFVQRLSADVFARFGDYRTMLPRMMRLPWILTAIAEVRGRPVAFAMYSLEDLPRGEIDLVAIAVEPVWESRGVGRALLAHVEREADRLAPGGAAAAVRLTVARDNERARRVFERTGFHRIPGEEGIYPGGQRSITLRKVVPRSGLDSNAPGPELE
jgi:ribosomal protein S18 acetylase RimI-like enzyme